MTEIIRKTKRKQKFFATNRALRYAFETLGYAFENFGYAFETLEYAFENLEYAFENFEYAFENLIWHPAPTDIPQNQISRKFIFNAKNNI
ncbi:MAG: hypothetical protein LBR17_02150 [Bacteroidales bacterium]|jgi:hypothetical protein|nr:hypothetical protein [Bacteroidales bacterium]